jgi:hypothetical protein
MKKILMINLILLGIMGCSEPQNQTTDSALDRIQLPDQNAVEPQIEQRRVYEDMPNDDTQTINIVLNKAMDDPKFIHDFEQKLVKDHFNLSKRTDDRTWSTNDCELNQIIKITGSGVYHYAVSSQVGIGQNKDYYPDFNMTILSFETEQEAIQQFKRLASSVNYQQFCNGKSPEKIMQKYRYIIYLSTRAELFRTYINRYAEFIEQYKEMAK